MPDSGSCLQGSAEVQFIDFEYSSYTYATFDIANHFCEYAGFECDYSRFPGNDHMRRFMCHYLSGGVSDPAVSSAIKGRHSSSQRLGSFCLVAAE